LQYVKQIHLDGGELIRFDMVITNPPFSQNYSKDGMKFAERFRYGFCPESGKKDDLMFLQHMLAILRTNGMMATVMPPGVLFRGGAEKEIRKGVIEDDLLEAVIGFPPNLFYGTGIPACVLVCRAKGALKNAYRSKIKGSGLQRYKDIRLRPPLGILWPKRCHQFQLAYNYVSHLGL
jgi:type I restriction enzyme M protein